MNNAGVDRSVTDTRTSKRVGGFTLMELMVAVFIVSLMAAVVVPHLLGAGKRAQAVACEENQQLIRAALTEYNLIYHTYPQGTVSQQLQVLKDVQLLQSIPTEPSGGNYIITSSNNDVEVSCDVHGELGNP